MEHINITPEGIVEFQQITVSKRMTLSQFSREMTSVIGGSDTPILPYGTIKYSKSPNGSSSIVKLALLVQPRVLNINYYDNRYKFATPYMLYMVRVSGSHFYIARHFVMTQSIDENTPLYCSHLPNTYTDNRVCTGRVRVDINSENVCRDILTFIGTLESSNFNNDLTPVYPQLISHSREFTGDIPSAIRVWHDLSSESNESFWTLDNSIGWRRLRDFDRAWRDLG